MFTVFTVKIAIVLQNRRITGLTSRRWRIVHWTYFALFVCLLPICTLLRIFPCQPVADYFMLEADAETPNIKCLDVPAIEFATRMLHAVTDWLLVPIPLIIIWRLQMPLGKKIRVMMVFCVGFTSSVATIARNVVARTQDTACKSSYLSSQENASLTDYLFLS